MKLVACIKRDGCFWCGRCCLCGLETQVMCLNGLFKLGRPFIINGINSPCDLMDSKIGSGLKFAVQDSTPLHKSSQFKNFIIKH